MKKRKNLIRDSHDIIDSILNSRVFKIAKVTVIVVGGLYAFGLGCKILNFSMINYMELKKTLQ